MHCLNLQFLQLTTVQLKDSEAKLKFDLDFPSWDSYDVGCAQIYIFSIQFTFKVEILHALDVVRSIKWTVRIHCWLQIASCIKHGRETQAVYQSTAMRSQNQTILSQVYFVQHKFQQLYEAALNKYQMLFYLLYFCFIITVVHKQNIITVHGAPSSFHCSLESPV